MNFWLNLPLIISACCCILLAWHVSCMCWMNVNDPVSEVSSPNVPWTRHWAAHVEPSSMMIPICVEVLEEPFDSVQRKGWGEKNVIVGGIKQQSKVKMRRFICQRQQTGPACFHHLPTTARQWHWKTGLGFLGDAPLDACGEWALLKHCFISAGRSRNDRSVVSHVFLTARQLLFLLHCCRAT